MPVLLEPARTEVEDADTVTAKYRKFKVRFPYYSGAQTSALGHRKIAAVIGNAGAGVRTSFRPLRKTNFLSKFSQRAIKWNRNTRANVGRFPKTFRRLYEQGASSMRL